MQAGESVVDAAQVLLTGYDISLSREWRDEDRNWRREDLDWREIEQECMNRDYGFMQHELRWREADIEQRHLDNARYLWAKFVEKNKRDVEEKAGQLKAISGLAALLAGFTMVAFLEMQFTFNEVQQLPHYKIVLPLHGVTTGLTVAVQLTCVVMCTLMLSGVLRIGKSFVGEEEEAEFMLRCKAFAATFKLSDRPPAPARTFAAHWALTLEAQWRHAVLLFSGGLPLFCLQLALAAWVKFWQSVTAAIVVSVVMGVAILVLMLLQGVWSRHLMHHTEFEAADRYGQAPMGLPFDWHLKPQPPDIWASSNRAGHHIPSSSTASTGYSGRSEGCATPLSSTGNPWPAAGPHTPHLQVSFTQGRHVGHQQHGTGPPGEGLPLHQALQQEGRHQWQRQDPRAEAPLPGWGLAAALVGWLLEGWRQATGWVLHEWRVAARG